MMMLCKISPTKVKLPLSAQYDELGRCIHLALCSQDLHSEQEVPGPDTRFLVHKPRSQIIKKL